MNDTEMETLFREGLRRRADEAEVPSDLVRRARPSRRRAWVVPVAAAAAVLAVVGGGLAVRSVPHGHHHRDRSVSRPSVAPTPVIDSTWRTEAWHGLQVSVPADWGWGTAPISEGHGGASLCGGAGAMVLADGTDRVNPDASVPYVGRPVMLSDLCQGVVEPMDPHAPYVWLGADVDPGTVDVGNGYTQETVEVDGTTLTVATDDATLRRRILDSATSAECPATVVGQLPHAYSMGPGRSGRIVRAQMCVFQRDRQLELVYADRLDATRAQAYADAAASAPNPGSLPDILARLGGSCPTDELAAIRLTRRDTEGEYVDTTLVDLDCGWVTTTQGDYRTLDPATRAAVTDGTGLPAILHSLIGMLG